MTPSGSYSQARLGATDRSEIGNKRSRTSLEGWTFDPDLYKPGISSYSYDVPNSSPNVGP